MIYRAILLTSVLVCYVILIVILVRRVVNFNLIEEENNVTDNNTSEPTRPDDHLGH